jgi:hypothetical protein
MARPRYPLARLSPAKDEMLVLAVTRESATTGDILPLLEKLAPLVATREAARRWEGKVTFYFDGWDEDPRETAEIPEIRAYFRELTEQWPYWWHFIEKVGDTFGHVLRLLCRGHVERIDASVVGWQFDDPDELMHQTMRLFAGMNGLYDQLGLSEEANERVSQEIAQLLECSLQ